MSLIFSKNEFSSIANLFFGNSVIIDKNTSFTDFRNESKLFNRSTSYGISGIFLRRNKFSYYQSRQYGVKFSILKSTSSWKNKS